VTEEERKQRREERKQKDRELWEQAEREAPCFLWMEGDDVWLSLTSGSYSLGWRLRPEFVRQRLSAREDEKQNFTFDFSVRDIRLLSGLIAALVARYNTMVRDANANAKQARIKALEEMNLEHGIRAD